MKILVGYVEDLKHSGIDKYLLNVVKIAKENDVVLDFLTSQYSQEAAEYLSGFGCNVYTVCNLKKPQDHYKDVCEILRKGNYDKAYFNISEPLNMMGPKAAHDCGVYTIIHSHSSGMDIANKYKRLVRGFINDLCRPMLSRFGDEFFACSTKAGYWMYTKKIVESDKFSIIYNSVDATKFKPDAALGEAKRTELNIPEDSFVIGHVGNYCYAKNNFFLVDIMAEVIKEKSNALMLCIGDGADREAVEAYAKERGVYDNMRFLGIRSDVSALMNALDVFVLPSRFEGMPIVAIEAQLCGIPCVVSSNIDRLVLLSNTCESISIDDASDWAKVIVNLGSKKDETSLAPDALSKFSVSESKNQIVNILIGG